MSGQMLENTVLGMDSSSPDVFNVVPSDTTDFAKPIRGFSFATAGAIKIKTLAGAVVTIPSGTLAPGLIHPIFVRRIYATGTTVTNILGAI